MDPVIFPVQTLSEWKKKTTDKLFSSFDVIHDNNDDEKIAIQWFGSEIPATRKKSNNNNNITTAETFTPFISFGEKVWFWIYI